MSQIEKALTAPHVLEYTYKRSLGPVLSQFFTALRERRVVGVRRKDDTLPERWFEEPNPSGKYKGEKIDRAEFDALLSRFYAISNLDEEGVPVDAWRRELEAALAPTA